MHGTDDMRSPARLARVVAQNSVDHCASQPKRQRTAALQDAARVRAFWPGRPAGLLHQAAQWRSTRAQSLQCGEPRRFWVEAPERVASHQLRREVGVGQPKAEPGEKIRVGVRSHSPAISLSVKRVCARVRGLGTTLASRAPTPGTVVIRSGPFSGRTRSVRPLPRRTRTLPSRSPGSKTTSGSRSSSRMVTVLRSDISSAFPGPVKSARGFWPPAEATLQRI